jgi:hypothetical protein
MGIKGTAVVIEGTPSRWVVIEEMPLAISGGADDG